MKFNTSLQTPKDAMEILEVRIGWNIKRMVIAFNIGNEVDGALEDSESMTIISKNAEFDADILEIFGANAQANVQNKVKKFLETKYGLPEDTL